ncbi:uncharacterized protein LOC110712922 [Chenopodium quinoa]|uniref:uncharacterized protein LOC110712922 n=1 Tax=Chenopodium quinoa TaxID=63459 RepID=UPI000B796808|nr:uncharacterized protein LOC110712922 [Chenopodium quinoa]
MVETEVAALIAPWLTPTSLFVLLNIVLATIFLANNKHHSQTKHDSDSDSDNRNNMNNKPSEHHYHHNQYDYYQNNQRYDYEGASLVPPPPQLVRAPSLFSRVASFNFSNFYSEAQPPLSDAADQTATMTRAPSLLYRVTSFNFSRSPAPQKAVEEEARDQSQGHVMRENQKEVVEKDKAKETKVKKKKVKKEVNSDVKKEVTAVKNESTAVKKEVAKETTSSKRVEEEEVDSKADDFIHKFKQQLKLQRLESLLRYRNNPTPTAA